MFTRHLACLTQVSIYEGNRSDRSLCNCLGNFYPVTYLYEPPLRISCITRIQSTLHLHFQQLPTLIPKPQTTGCFEGLQLFPRVAMRCDLV